MTSANITQKFNNCNLEETLFIDDIKHIINLLNNNGINSNSIKNIEN